ncbi:hypothetical protein Pcinc_009019 [Petrolisthes cinctipes]|uniref:Uncharacterized protein n=1 Tax=Petrolisthes cinctipes TaxID=88211 RepID=A0AAE1GC30_PETCI|nr:hypothetical protein Pcinc_009019 [Petrolisthes cinctipes]
MSIKYEISPHPLVLCCDVTTESSDIDVAGVKSLVNQREIHCARPGNLRSNAGKPTYKSQEEQYQEIQELRRDLGELREENSSLRTRSRRLEEDLLRRDRQLHQLMDPAKNDEARRQLTDKGASVVSSLKLRVSRLEATLRDKEAEVAKLRASAKATALHEMKVEAETYYQEVVRLRNQLNILQQQQQQHYHHHPQPHSPHSSTHPPPLPPQSTTYPPPPPPPHSTTSPQHPAYPTLPHPSTHPKHPPPPPPHHQHYLHQHHQRNVNTMHRDLRDGGDGQESPSADLRLALAQLEEENAILGQRVTSLTSEKDKLATDLERVLDNYEGLGRMELIHEVEQRQAEVVRWEAQHRQLSETLQAANTAATSDVQSQALLQAKVAEMHGRETEWERERASLRELISTLKDDRLFYKETAEKKDSELDSLRQEVQSLQQEVSDLHKVTRRPLHQPSPRQSRPSPRATPSSASRSGSSSEANTPIRRARPSSARPPPSTSRTQRPPKSSSEPRELPPKAPGKNRRTLTPQTSGKSGPTSGKPNTTLGKSNATVGKQNTSGKSASTLGKPGVTNSDKRGPSVTRSGVTASPKHNAVVRNHTMSSSATSSKASTPSASPRKSSTASSSSSPQHHATQQRGSPQHKVPPLQQKSTSKQRGTSQQRVSPQHQRASPQRHHKSSLPSQSSSSPSKSSSTTTASPTKYSSSSPTKISSNKASPAKSFSPTPSPSKSSPSVSSPRKATTQSRSPSKVPQPKITAGRGREENASPLHTPHSPRKQTTSVHSSSIEEDERVLSEIIFHRETDSSGEASDYPSSNLERQKTITLAHSEVQDPQDTESGSVVRQNTMTLSREEDEEEYPRKDMRDKREGGKEEKKDSREERGNESSVCEKENEAATVLNGKGQKSVVTSQDSEIIENLELLQCLLSSHLSRQRQVNELLNQEPLLVGEAQVSPTTRSPEKYQSPSSKRRSRRGQREAPDGQEAGGQSGAGMQHHHNGARGQGEASQHPQRSHSLVRQGTFNVDDDSVDGDEVVQAVLDAHLTRITKLSSK